MLFLYILKEKDNCDMFKSRNNLFIRLATIYWGALMRGALLGTFYDDSLK